MGIKNNEPDESRREKMGIEVIAVDVGIVTFSIAHIRYYGRYTKNIDTINNNSHDGDGEDDDLCKYNFGISREQDEYETETLDFDILHWEVLNLKKNVNASYSVCSSNEIEENNNSDSNPTHDIKSLSVYRDNLAKIVAIRSWIFQKYTNPMGKEELPVVVVESQMDHIKPFKKNNNKTDFQYHKTEMNTLGHVFMSCIRAVDIIQGNCDRKIINLACKYGMRNDGSLSYSERKKESIKIGTMIINKSNIGNKNKWKLFIQNLKKIKIKLDDPFDALLLALEAARKEMDDLVKSPAYINFLFQKKASSTSVNITTPPSTQHIKRKYDIKMFNNNNTNQEDKKKRKFNINIFNDKDDNNTFNTKQKINPYSRGWTDTLISSSCDITPPSHIKNNKRKYEFSIPTNKDDDDDDDTPKRKKERKTITTDKKKTVCVDLTHITHRELSPPLIIPTTPTTTTMSGDDDDNESEDEIIDDIEYKFEYKTPQKNKKKVTLFKKKKGYGNIF